MEKFYTGVIRHRKKIVIVYAVVFLLCLFLQRKVSVNYDMNSYLPEDSPSTVALNVMEEEFEGAIPNARVMIRDVTIPEALEYKEKLQAMQGVSDVTWLDDVVDVKEPIETQEQETVETYYKDGTALYTLTLEEDQYIPAVKQIRELIGDENAMTGAAVSTATATQSTVSEIQKIALIAVLFVFVVLMLTTTSWAEPVIIMMGLGVAVVINAGTNLIFGEISFVTNAAGNILQLAVSLDYSVFLIHRFEECRKETGISPEEAMIQALCKSTSSILSSGLTTVIGFLALVLMRFQIGSDLGLALAKGVAISLITVFVFMPGVILMTYRFMDRTGHRSFLPSFRGFGRFVSQVTVPLVAIFVLTVVPDYLASNHNDYYYGASHIFGAGTQLGEDTQEIESVFGQKDTYVLLVPKGSPALEQELSQELQKLPQVTSIISYVDMAGPEIPYEYVEADTLKKLESENYSRMVLSVNAAYEGEATFQLVEDIRNIANDYYPSAYYLAGEGVSTYDLMDTVTADMVKVNLVAIGAVFVVLLLTMHSVVLPVILVVTIESAIWLNLGIYYFAGKPLFYIAYLIISSIQLGATVDYAILYTDRYREHRASMNKKDSVVQTIASITPSVLTSGSVLTVVGFLLGKISTHGLLSQLGYLLGRGSLCSLAAVLFVLPGLLYLFDGVYMRRNKKQTEIIQESEVSGYENEETV